MPLQRTFTYKGYDFPQSIWVVSSYAVDKQNGTARITFTGYADEATYSADPVANIIGTMVINVPDTDVPLLFDSTQTLDTIENTIYDYVRGTASFPRSSSVPVFFDSSTVVVITKIGGGAIEPG